MSLAGKQMRRDGEAGWTLVEMLIALALLGLITTLLAGAVTQARRGLASIDQLGQRERVIAVEAHLRRTLSQVRSVRLPGSQSSDPLIEASPQSLKFVSDYSPQGQFAGLYVVELGLSPRATGGLLDLVERRTPYRPAREPGTTDPPTPALSTVLVPAIADAQFSLFGAVKPREPPIWQQSWSNTSSLPKLVSIMVSFTRGDTRRWIPLTVNVPAAR